MPIAKTLVDICEATPINRMESGVPNAECERDQVCSELIAPFCSY